MINVEPMDNEFSSPSVTVDDDVLGRMPTITGVNVLGSDVAFETSLPDTVDVLSVVTPVIGAVLKSVPVEQNQFYITADSEHCFDLSGLISAVGVTEGHIRRIILLVQ